MLAPLLVARVQPPSLPEVYELMTDTWAHSTAAPKREDLVYLIEGVRLFPNRLRLLYQVAGFSADAGLLDVAHAFTDYGIKVSIDAKSRGLFEKLKAALPPAPPVPDPKAGAPAPKKGCARPPPP
ncbi:MAG: hypothetical protein NTV51_20480, partial [Verrucomicrobia bacterium]|nr:hypothetical protein [Verrucomicrobiota bacterium]